MTDKIVVTYWEGDEGDDYICAPGTGKSSSSFTKMVYAEWTRNGVPQWAWADEAEFVKGSGAVRGIPDDVRETIALLIAPSLRRADK